MSSSPRTGMRSERWPSAKRSAIRDAERTGSTTCRETSSAIPASRTSSTRPPVAMVPRTRVIVLSSLLSGKIRYSSRLRHPGRGRGADQQRRAGEALGVHGGVLVADLSGLDEVAQRLRDLVDRAGRGRRPRAVAGNHQHRVEGAGQRGAGGLAGLGDQGVAGQLQAAVQRARLFTADDAADGVAGPVDLLGGGAHLDVEHPVGDLAGEHEAEHQDHGQPKGQASERRPAIAASGARSARPPDSAHSCPEPGGRTSPGTADAPPRAEDHQRAHVGRITEVRPCIPLLERSAPPAGSPGPSRPWPASAGHARSPNGCPRDGDIPTPVRAAHHE